MPRNRNFILNAICDSLGHLVSSTYFLVMIRYGIQASSVTRCCI